MLISNVGFNPQIKRQNYNKSERKTIEKTGSVAFGLLGLFRPNKYEKALIAADITNKKVIDAFGKLSDHIDFNPFLNEETHFGLLNEPADVLKKAVHIIEKFILNEEKQPQKLRDLRKESTVFSTYAKMQIPEN